MNRFVNDIICGDSLEVLKQFPDNSIDSVITDPPYGLSKHTQSLIKDVLKHWLDGDESYMPKRKGFMNSVWDAFVPPPAIWKEVYRVMKPGASAMVFAGSRTQDLMAMSLRLSGFDLKDTLMWIYGSGWSKGLNISKGIDKKLGFADQRGYIKPTGGLAKGSGNTVGCYTGKQLADEGYSPEAKMWEGYNTCLKPAYEPILFVMKPNDENYVNNALKWGVSGLNIDACRINSRFPSNVIFGCTCDKVIYKEYKVKGFLKDNKPQAPSNYNDNNSGVMHTNPNCPGYILENQHKGSSRFFYCSKASKSERNLGLEGFEEKPAGAMSGRHDGSLDGKIVYNQNIHSTVKPLKLIQYLVKIVSMPNSNQIYLDPFLGSGTTAMACKLLGKNYIGIEKNAEYYAIAQARVKAVQRPILQGGR